MKYLVKSGEVNLFRKSYFFLLLKLEGWVFGNDENGIYLLNHAKITGLFIKVFANKHD